MLSKKCKTCDKIFFKEKNRSIKYWMEKANFCSNSCKVYSQKGFYKHWQGKKRPGLSDTEASKTMFKKGQASWNKGRGKGTNPLKLKYRTYRANAKSRGLLFELSFDEFSSLLSLNCVYCGEKATGVDRIDNSIGYIKNNSASACKICNHMKWILSKEDFINKCKEIVENSKLVGYEI